MLCNMEQWDHRFAMYLVFHRGGGKTGEAPAPKALDSSIRVCLASVTGCRTVLSQEGKAGPFEVTIDSDESWKDKAPELNMHRERPIDEPESV